MDVADSKRWDVFRGYSGRLMVIVSIGWFAIRLGREAMPPLLPAIIQTVDITPSTAGFGLTVMWLIYSLSQYPGGRYSDGLSRKTVLVGSLLTAVLGFVVLSVITTYLGLLVGFALIGLGGGFYFAPSRAVLADLFTTDRGQAFGIMSAAGSVGAASAAGVAVVALHVGLWQTAFLPVMVALAGALVAIHVWQQETYVVERVSLEIRPTLKRLVGLPRIRWFLVAYIAVSFTWQGFLGFLPTFLQIERGFSPVFASSAYALIFFIAIVVGPIAGRLADLLSRVLVAIAGLTVALVGFVSIVAVPHVAGALAGVVLISTGLRTYPPVMQAHLMGLFPDDSMAGDFGGTKLVWTGLGSLAPTYVGLVAASYSFSLAFAGFIGCMAVGVAVLAYLYVTGDD